MKSTYTDRCVPVMQGASLQSVEQGLPVHAWMRASGPLGPRASPKWYMLLLDMLRAVCVSESLNWTRCYKLFVRLFAKVKKMCKFISTYSFLAYL